MKVFNDVDFIDALSDAAIAYRTMLTGIWSSMISAMPQQWLGNFANEDYFAPALVPAARPVDKAALLQHMTNAPFVESGERGVALISVVTGGFDPAGIITIAYSTLAATEVLAIKAATIAPPTIGPIIPIFPSIFDGHGLFKPWENVHQRDVSKSITNIEGPNLPDLKLPLHVTYPAIAPIAAVKYACKMYVFQRYALSVYHALPLLYKHHFPHRGYHVDDAQLECFTKLQQAAAGRIISCAKSP